MPMSGYYINDKISKNENFKKIYTYILQKYMITQHFHGKEITYLRRFVEKNFDGSSNCKKL